MKNVILFLMFATLLSGTSCGSRKSSKSKTENKSETNIETSAKTTAVIEKDVQNDIHNQTDIVAENEKKVENNVVEENENLEPIDPTKPMTKEVVIEGNKTTTKWENAKVNNGKKTDNTVSEEKSNLNDKSLFTDNSRTKDLFDFNQNLNYKREDETSSETSNKETDAQRGFSFWWLLLLVIPLGLYLWWRYRRISPV